jgi:periplasmic protein TonB
MAKPLRSELTNPPNRQFEHFGVLNSGSQNKGAFFGSIAFNLILLLIAIIIGASVKKTIDQRKKMDLTYVVPIKEPPPQPKPKIPPPPKLPPPKPIETPEPPKIKIPEVKLVEPPKPIPVVAPKPVPVIVPAPPKIQQAAAAPKVVSVTMAPKSASVVNNDPHPTAVALGHPDSPVPFQKSGPAVAAVNMNRGMAGMPATNSGGGPPAKAISLGNGSPGGQIGGTAVAKVEGVKIGGCIGCTGNGPGNGNKPQAAQVGLGQTLAAAPTPTQIAKTPMKTAPQVLFKPKPAYTAEATNQHIEGTVIVKIKVAASGAVTVVGVQSGLGDGLDESAVQCARGIRFKPAVDASGNPIDWEGVVNITFQMA